jgi:hypothetical protein
MKTLAMLKLLRFLVGPPALHWADEPQRIEREQTLEMQPCKGKRRNTVADVNLHKCLVYPETRSHRKFDSHREQHLAAQRKPVFISSE